jgi:hypothetical protein
VSPPRWLITGIIVDYIVEDQRSEVQNYKKKKKKKKKITKLLNPA